MKYTLNPAAPTSAGDDLSACGFEHDKTPPPSCGGRFVNIMCARPGLLGDRVHRTDGYAASALDAGIVYNSLTVNHGDGLHRTGSYAGLATYTCFLIDNCLRHNAFLLSKG